MKNKMYTFKTVKDITQSVTVDNIDNFVDDFKTWLLAGLNFKKLNLPKSLIKMDTSQFRWVDDGLHDALFEMKSTVKSKK